MMPGAYNGVSCVDILTFVLLIREEVSTRPAISKNARGWWMYNDEAGDSLDILLVFVRAVPFGFRMGCICWCIDESLAPDNSTGMPLGDIASTNVARVQTSG